MRVGRGGMFAYIFYKAIIPHHIEFCSKLMDDTNVVNALWLDTNACPDTFIDIFSFNTA